ncbi:MAG: hypothetical protein KBC64_06245 [Simkaniaceae bacterium]|nr:hypothetical protein [Simkaniaceae bacterium]
MSFPLHAAKIGLLIVATGKYDQFIPRLINSARTYFCPGEQVTYYVFADGVIPEGNDIVSIYQKRLGWPLDTLMRNDIYARHQERFQQEDYLFAIDADMLFVDVVGREILGTRVATRHPGFMNQRGTYETNPQSQAYVKDTEGTHYYAGAFFGGTRESFLHIISETTRRIQLDLQQSMIAIWHDESHWNRYCIDHPPTVILSPSYCYPESQKLDYQRKLLALDKNHAAFRSPN